MKCLSYFLTALVLCCSVSMGRAQQNNVALNSTTSSTPSSINAPAPVINNAMKVEEPTRVRGVKMNTHHRRCKRRRIHLFR